MIHKARARLGSATQRQWRTDVLAIKVFVLDKNCSSAVRSGGRCVCKSTDPVASWFDFRSRLSFLNSLGSWTLSFTDFSLHTWWISKQVHSAGQVRPLGNPQHLDGVLCTQSRSSLLTKLETCLHPLNPGQSKKHKVSFCLNVHWEQITGVGAGYTVYTTNYREL